MGERRPIAHVSRRRLKGERNGESTADNVNAGKRRKSKIRVEGVYVAD